MTEGNMQARDFYFRTTDKNGGVSVVRTRVWDAARFTQAQMDSAVRDGGKFETITAEQYAKERA